METKSSSIRITLLSYIIYGCVFTAFIFLFSVIMAAISAERNSINDNNYAAISNVYNGPIKQSAPNLDMISMDSEIYTENRFSPTIVKLYVDNTHLVSTNGVVTITADFVKKGLVYQPTYQTKFETEYILKNSLAEDSYVTFQFPFPINTDSNEISNVKLVVNGEEIQDAKTKITTPYESEYDSAYYDYYTVPEIDGLKWSGKIEANSEIKVIVSYDTVGLSEFIYEGIENSKGSQDFNFEVKILGTRSYDIAQGLSVDSRKFGDKEVQLVWNKPDLYSKPLINIRVGDKLNPSEQVSRVYLTMTPIYILFISILLFLAYKFGKKLKVFDMFLITGLFTIYFPLIHYLSSFTIDPTVEIFANIKDVSYYSMPLYMAFVIAWLIAGGLMYYLLGKVSGFKFASKLGLPTMILFMGFFPLVVTIPEYSMLLVIIGVIALIAIVIQVRIKLLKE